MRKIRVDEHITMILQFSLIVSPKSGIKGTYNTYREKLNAVGKRSFMMPSQGIPVPSLA